MDPPRPGASRALFISLWTLNPKPWTLISPKCPPSHTPHPRGYTMVPAMNQPDQHAAILLLAHGTPNVLSEMADYLQKVTGGRPMPAAVVEELQHRYAEIGLAETPLPDGPPLTRWTLRQAALLSDLLGRHVYVGMRNWDPTITDVVAQMKADGVTHARVLCLAPQNSRTSTGLYRRALESALTSTPGDAFTFDFIAGWSDEPLLAQAFAESLWPTWATACAETATRVPVLFTAHSVPCRTIHSAAPAPHASTPGAPEHNTLQDYGDHENPDPYPVECKHTAEHVAKALAPVGMTPADWFFAFQSQGIAGAPWIGPTVEETLRALAAEGHKAVVLQPIGFLCDHVEILYDIDIAFTQTSANLGLKLYRPPSLNDSPTLIRALNQVLTA
jgi:ferrochelatase